MSYTISSRGQPIGTTDLGFARFDESSRSGWFRPNALGETLMSGIAMALPAMRAFFSRDVRDADGRSILQPNFLRSSLFADLAEAFHHADSLDLTLHHADGTPIPTSMIGIQDTEQLLELARWSDLYEASDPLSMEEADESDLAQELEEALERDSAHRRLGGHEPDDDDLDALFGDWSDTDEPWRSENEAPRFPRYQVHVLLAEANGIA